MEFELSHQAFYEVWKYFELGTKPLTLNVLPQGVVQSERKEAEDRAWDELRRLGINDRDRADDIYGLLLPLQRYERTFDITYRYLVDGEDCRKSGMVAEARGSATLALRSEKSVRLAGMRPDSMMRALLGVLPEIQAGPGKGVSLRSAQFDEAAAGAGSSNRAMSEGLVRRGVRKEDARNLVEMAGSKRIAFAQFGASIMDTHGRRRRAAMVTNCFATASGWYMMEESRRGSEPWTTFAPTDKARMRSRVQDLLKAVPRD